MGDFGFDDEEGFDDLFDELDTDLDDLDKDSESGDSGEDQEQRQATFESNVNKNIKMLGSPRTPAGKRREAARWLGESGEPKAITALVKSSRKDPDKSVREAAVYALSMFKALDEALKGSPEQQDQAYALLSKIVNEGKMGKRLPIPTRALVIIEVFLTATFAVMLILALVLPGRSSDTGDNAVAQRDLPTLASDIDASAVLADANTLRTWLTDDLVTLQMQLANAKSGGSIDCTATFNDPQPYPVTTALEVSYPALAGAISQLNQIQANIAAVRTTYTAACQTDAAPLTGDQIDSMTQSLVSAQQSLPEIQIVLQNPDIVDTPTPGPTPELPTATEPPPTDTPIPPTPTFDMTVARPHIASLTFIIDNVDNQRGANALLGRYWNDVVQVGDTNGCREPPPAVPDDYTLPEDIGSALPDLKQAADSVNTGLALLRQGWQLFAASCANHTLTNDASTGVSISQTANSAFQAADAILRNMR